MATRGGVCLNSICRAGRTRPCVRGCLLPDAPSTDALTELPWQTAPVLPKERIWRGIRPPQEHGSIKGRCRPVNEDKPGCPRRGPFAARFRMRQQAGAEPRSNRAAARAPRPLSAAAGAWHHARPPRPLQDCCRWPCNRERPGHRPGSSCLAVRSRLHKLPWCFLLTGAPETPQLTIVPPNRPSRREFRPHPP